MRSWIINIPLLLIIMSHMVFSMDMEFYVGEYMKNLETSIKSDIEKNLSPTGEWIFYSRKFSNILLSDDKFAELKSHLENTYFVREIALTLEYSAEKREISASYYRMHAIYSTSCPVDKVKVKAVAESFKPSIRDAIKACKKNTSGMQLISFPKWNSKLDLMYRPLAIRLAIQEMAALSNYQILTDRVVHLNLNNKPADGVELIDLDGDAH